jgi:DNA-binding response OmpR family regulator
VLEDDELYQQLYRTLLEPLYRVTVHADLAALRGALDGLARGGERPALLVADMALPDGTLLPFLATPAWHEAKLAPFLVTSGVTDLQAMRECMREGATDYITKPFVGSELLLKIELAVDRAPQRRPVLDQLSCTVTFEGRSSEALTLREMHLFLALSDGFEGRVAKADVVKRVWGETHVAVRAFDVHLAHLRAKLKPLGLEITFIAGGHYTMRPIATAATAG